MALSRRARSARARSTSGSSVGAPPNGYNDQDPGMKIVAPLINAAIGG